MTTTLTDTRTGVVDSERVDRLGRLVREQFGFVWRLLRGLGVTETETDAAAQAVFEAAALRIGDIRIGNERPFLLSTTLHVVASVRRNRGGEPALISDDAIALEDLDEQRQARVILGALLEQMPLELRLVFVLHEIERLTPLEIASMVGIPSATVLSRLADAQEDFATHLETESELSNALLNAARAEQPTPSSLLRALSGTGAMPPCAESGSEGVVPTVPFAVSARPAQGRAARSRLGLAAKWLIFGGLVGVLVSAVEYWIER